MDTKSNNYARTIGNLSSLKRFPRFPIVLGHILTLEIGN